MRGAWWIGIVLLAIWVSGDALAQGFSSRAGESRFQPGPSRHDSGVTGWGYVNPPVQNNEWNGGNQQHNHWPGRPMPPGQVLLLQPANSCNVEAMNSCGGCSISCPQGQGAYCTPGQETILGSFVRCVRRPSCYCR